jgi:ornithine cyclodeaminase
MKLPIILTDDDIAKVPFTIILKAVRRHILADFRGETTAPPRHTVDFGSGALVFTSGGTANHAGFRVYDTFGGSKLALEDQIVAAWDTSSRRLVAVAIGEMLGAMRTGAIGGVAIDRMAPKSCEKLAVIGTGLQASTQIRAALAVRDFERIEVFSRNRERRETFCAKLGNEIGRSIMPGAHAETVVNGADVVILATDASKPVMDLDWLKPGCHVSTIGPKSKAAHELPLNFAGHAGIIATDSPQQIAAMGDRHMLAGAPAFDRITHLGSDKAIRGQQGEFTLFLSAGLAGTEVAALVAVAASIRD